MTYRIALPDPPVGSGQTRTDRSTLDIVDPYSSAIQSVLRRSGLAGYEPATMAAMLAQFDRAGRGFRFVDVGANIGLYSLLAATLFDPGDVVAFEPTPDLVAIARRIAQANDVAIDVRPCAVSSAAGRAALHLASVSDVSNSLVEGFKASETSVEVDTVRLDDVAADWSDVPTVMKIDVEGHEADVLAGAHATIRDRRPVIFVEVLNRMGDRLARGINGQLDGLGYSCYRLDTRPTWERRAEVARSTDGHFDWMLTPEPLDDEFAATWEDWHSRIARCTSDRNSRVPVIRTTMAAIRREGIGGAVEAVRRFLGRPSTTTT